MRALPSKLSSHVYTTLIKQIPIPSRRYRDTRRKHTRIADFSNSQRPILETETVKAYARDCGDVADARARDARD